MQSITFNQKAFTMVELVLVVVLIGIIAVFAIPGYTKSVRKTQEKAATNNLLIIYAGQKIKAGGGGNFYVDDASPTLAELNTDLNLSIIANNITYNCPSGSGSTSFECRASYEANPSPNRFTLMVNNVSAAPNVCCCTGTNCNTCPSISTTCACTGGCP